MVMVMHYQIEHALSYVVLRGIQVHPQDGIDVFYHCRALYDVIKLKINCFLYFLKLIPKLIFQEFRFF